jgi:uncharacterized membrane protein
MGDIIQIVTLVVLALLAYMLAKVYDTLAHIARSLDNFPRDRLEDSKILQEIKNNVENAADKLYYISNASDAVEISEEKNKKRDEERERVWAEDHAKQVQLRQRGG